MAAKKKKENKTRVKSSSLKLEEITKLGGTEEDVALLQDVEDSGSGSEAESVADDVSDDDSIQQDEIQNFLKQLDIEKHRPKVKGSKREEPANAANEDQDQEPSTSSTSSSKVDKKEKNKYKVQHAEVSSSVKDPGVEYRAHVRAYQHRKYLLVKPGEFFDTAEASEGDGKVKLPADLTKQMEEFAAKLLSDEIDIYNKQRENAKRSDVQWMRTVLTSGTLADKVAALTVLLQETPLHNVTYLDTLLNMARKKNRRENLQAIDTLKELFLTDVMPSNRKLKTFSQHDLASLGQTAGWNRDSMDKRLVLWQYEAQLKAKYTEFVNILKTLAHDVLLPTKQKAVSTIFNLLVEKPEQEKLLLTTLINKVGDPHYKLAATVSHLLTKLVETHPNMKTIVVREVEQLIFRPNMAERAQYYSVCFLNQLRLSASHRQLATKLIGIYFAFFKGFVKKGEVDSKMMSALLSGVNRAYPYAKLEEKVLAEQLEHLYKIVHIVNFNTSLQALMLLYQVMGTSENISERYYNALYRKLVDPALETSSKQAAFLNLLFKSIKMDESERRIKAFVKRLLQVCRYQQPPFTCGALVLLSEVLKVKPGVLTLTHTEEDSDDEEHFVDQPAPDDPDETINPDPDGDKVSSDVEQTETKHKPASWVHMKNLNHKTERMDYDPYHRNPQYCHAENACIWELQGLAAHFHPSVALFARQILQGESIEYPGDPLQDFTLIRFLERFVFKNPKKTQQVEEKLGALSRVKSEMKGIKTLAVTSDTFANLEEKIVPVDDVFLHRYFRGKLSRKTASKKDDEDSDGDSISDSEFDTFLDKYEGNLDSADVDFDIDFSSEFGKKKGDSLEDSDDEDEEEEDDDLSDEEVDLNDDELAKEFQDEMEDTSDDDNGDFADVEEFADQFGVNLEGEGEEIEAEGGELEEGGEFDDKDLDFDEEDIQFSDDEFSKDVQGKGQKRKAVTKVLPQKLKKSRKAKTGDSADIYTAAEQFGDMLDETGGSKINMAGSHAFKNTDKAHAKQLKWEADRDRWLRGPTRKQQFNKKRGGPKFSKGKPVGKYGQFRGKPGKRK